MNKQNPTKKPAASYVSTIQDEDKNSPFFLDRGRQRDRIHKAAPSLGYDIVEEFGDLGASNEIDTRPNFRKMIAAARSDNCEFEAIIVTSMDRFSPVVAERMIIGAQLQAHGIELIGIT